jgi:hypothetical protein
VRIVAVGAAHNYAPSLPAIESFAMAASCPRFSLREVALRAEAVRVIERRAFSALERKELDIVGRVASGAQSARLHGVD